MKALGVVRRIDNLGRFAIPSGLGMNKKETVEISIRDGRIVLRKYEPTCYFCDGTNNIYRYKNKPVCRQCIENLKKGAKD